MYINTYKFTQAGTKTHICKHTHTKLVYVSVNSFGFECPNMSVLFRLLHKVSRS